MVNFWRCVFIVFAFCVSTAGFGQRPREGVAGEKGATVEYSPASARGYSFTEGRGNMGVQTFADIRFAQRFAAGSSTGGIQEAINDVCASKPEGGTVFLPLGRTTIGAPIYVPCNFVKIEGHGFNTLISSSAADIFVFPKSKVVVGLVFRDFSATTTGTGKSVFNLGSASIFLCEFDTLRLTANGGNGSSAILQPSTASIGLSYFHNIWVFTSVNNRTTSLLHFGPATAAYVNGNIFRNISVDQTGVTAGVPAIQIAISGTAEAQGNIFDGISGEVCNFGTFKISGVVANGALAGTVLANVWSGDRHGPNVGGEGNSSGPSIQIGPYAYNTDLRNVGLYGYVGSPGISIDPTAMGTKSWNSNFLDDAEAEINTQNATKIGQIIKLHASQTADALQVLNSSDVPIFRLRATGTVNSSGMDPDGIGFKHKRVQTGSIASKLDSTIIVKWVHAFVDANYTTVCSVLDTSTSQPSLEVIRLESVDTGSVVVRIRNVSEKAASGVLNCIAIHD